MKFTKSCVIFRPMKEWRTPIKLILIIILGAGIFASGFYFGKQEKKFVDPFEEMDLSLLSEVYHRLELNHPEFEDTSEEELVHGMIEGMIGALDDPHTAFFDPERSKIFLEDVAGEFEGVGIEIGIRDGALQVISPLEGTPADKAGLRSGDVIMSVDGDSTEDFTLEEAVHRIRGPKGEEVVLGILRNGEEKDFSVERDTIKPPSLEWSFIEEDTVHIEIFHFHENVGTEFSRMANEVKESPADKIILDLRGNPGGIFETAIDISGHFVGLNETVVVESSSKDKGQDAEEIEARGILPAFEDHSVVVLIDEGSASGSEIVAGALRDKRDAPIVGKRSFGKGSIQRLHDLSGGSMIKITEKYFFTPEGDLINGKGIEPDFEVEITREHWEEDEDPQLERALEVISDK